MCSIFGALGANVDLRVLKKLREAAGDRGRDGGRVVRVSGALSNPDCYLGNWRATPTPESESGRLQPYSYDSMSVVHNGTIANADDLGLRPGQIDSEILPVLLSQSDGGQEFARRLGMVVGSYALAAYDQERQRLYLACNYKPIYYAVIENCLYFSSMARHFDAILPFGVRPAKQQPYSLMVFHGEPSRREAYSLPRNTNSSRVVVIASGGLDSTTVAAKYVREGADVCLLHFTYGCRAESREIQAVEAIAKSLGCRSEIIALPSDPRLLSGSRLHSIEDTISGPVHGAEFAYEWVPARNLVMLSVATQFAENNGYGVIALGNNLEESGSYPDNEEEFTFLLDRALDYAVQNGNSVRIESPLGNLMKHEIVRLGLSLNTPYELTWSCYRAGDVPCLNCGPCLMRTIAFERNGRTDPLFEAYSAPVVAMGGLNAAV